MTTPYPKRCDNCIGRIYNICYPCERHGICEKCCINCRKSLSSTNMSTNAYNSFGFGHVEPQRITMHVGYMNENGEFIIREE